MFAFCDFCFVTLLKLAHINKQLKISYKKNSEFSLRPLLEQKTLKKFFLLSTFFHSRQEQMGFLLECF